jgi:hypothetical protein
LNETEREVTAEYVPTADQRALVENASAPITATATRGATQTVITAVYMNPVSSVRLELSRPSTTSASTIAPTANSIKAKPDDRVTGSTKATKGKNKSPAPMAKITPNSLRSQHLSTD